MSELNYWQRIADRRLGRRRFLAVSGSLALAASTAAVVGCGGGAPQAPNSGSNVTIGRLTNVLGVDPHIDLTGLDVDALVYSRLYDWDAFADGPIVNNFAESLEQPDHVTFIFSLRKGV